MWCDAAADARQEGILMSAQTLSRAPARKRGGARRVTGSVAAATVLAVLLSSVIAGTASAAPRPLSFDVVIGEFCIAGRAKNNSFIKIVQRDSSGNLKGRGVAEADAHGDWYFCGAEGVVEPGDKFNGLVFDTGQKRSFTVPRLTIKVNRATDVVSGKGPAGTALQVGVADSRFAYWGEEYDLVRNVVPNSSGAYATDFSADADILGGAQARVDWYNASGTVHVSRLTTAPYLSLAIGRSEFYGASRSNGPVKVGLSWGAAASHAEGNAVGAYFDSQFTGQLADEDGEPYRLRGGEMLSAPAVGASWQVPAVNMTVNVSSDKVSATCFAHARFVVLTYSSDFLAFAFEIGTTGASGAFTVDMTSQMNVRRGDTAQVVCLSSNGDEVAQQKKVN